MAVTRNQKIKNTVIIAMLCLCTFMGMLLTSARSVILGTLLNELNGYRFYSIAVIITSMMMAAVLPIAGKLSDMIGRKIISLLGIAGYGIAALICAISTNVYCFLGGIVLIGISYGLMSAVSGAIICDTYDEEVRPRYNSYINIASAAASLVGPVIGGWAVDIISWRFVYFIILPIAIVAFVACLLFLDNEKREVKEFHFDLCGMGAMLLCVIPVLFALAAGGNIYKWNSPVIIGCFVVAVIMAVSLVPIERKASEPIIPYTLLKNRSYVMCLLLTFLAWYAFAVMNYVTVYYQNVIGVAATVSGMLVVPRQLAQIVTSFLTGMLLVKWQAYKKSCTAFMFIYGLGMLLMSLFTSGTSFALIIIAELCFGIGISGQAVATNSFVQNTLRPSDIGTGLAFYNFLGSLASSSGAAIGGCIINQISDQELGLKATFVSYFLVIVVAFIVSIVSKWKPLEKEEKIWV